MYVHAAKSATFFKKSLKLVTLISALSYICTGGCGQNAAESNNEEENIPLQRRSNTNKVQKSPNKAKCSTNGTPQDTTNAKSPEMTNHVILESSVEIITPTQITLNGNNPEITLIPEPNHTNTKGHKVAKEATMV